MPIRDFTAATKATLLSAMKEIEEQDKRFWIFSGVIDTVDDWFIKDKVSAYEGDIAAYHKAILDKKDTSKAQLEAIWRDVYQVDGQYARDFQGMSDHIADLTSSVQSLTDALNPEAPSATGGIPAILRSPDELKSILKPFRSTEYTIDHRMQEQVFAILAEDRFSRETWNNATVAEREAAKYGEYFNYSLRPVTEEIRVFNKKHYWYPMRDIEVNSYPEFKQNPGW